jgi:hypothetical protein
MDSTGISAERSERSRPFHSLYLLKPTFADLSTNDGHSNESIMEISDTI